MRAGTALLLLLLLAACADPRGLPLDIPSAGETVFAEKRDITVVGYFDPPLTAPGNIRVELFRGGSAAGSPVRVLESHVDPATGVTPRSSLDFAYANGQAWGPVGPVADPDAIVMTPDLVAVPGGIEDPANKVVVTREYYAAVVLGGASRTFDTTYTGADGQPWSDLDAGTYTLRVTGLSGEVRGRTSTLRLEFGRTHALLGRFSPPEHLDRMRGYAFANGYRMYLDFFPGFFSHDGFAYEIPGRWMANNSVEVVNAFPGTLVDTVAAAANDVFLYNISATSATQRVEIGAITAHGLVTEQTTFHYYDIGEPSLTYLDAATGATRTLAGTIATFTAGDKLALTRVESKPADGLAEENRYDVGVNGPATIDVDLGDGVEVQISHEFSVYGVVVPLPSSTRPGPLPHQYEVDNAIEAIQYTITDGSGNAILDERREVGLQRRFPPAAAPGSPSIYEFRHEFDFGPAAGRYAVSVLGWDRNGQPVLESAAAFTLTVSGG